MTNVNKVVKILITSLIFLMIIPTQKNYAQSNSFYVYFKQNNKRINIVKNKVELKKQAFKIFVEYTEPIDLFINSSQKQETFLKAQKGKLMFNIPAFSNIKSPKDFFTKKNELIFSENDILIWEKGKTDYKKLIKTEKNRFVVSKNIEKFFNENKKSSSLLKDIKKKAYFVFIYAEKDKEGDFQEIQRELVKIKWVDSYKEETKRYARNKKREGKLKIKQAKRDLKRKQHLAKKEEKRLKKIEDHKLKKTAKEKEKAEKDAEKEIKKVAKEKSKSDKK